MIEQFFVWPVSVKRKTGQSANTPLFGEWDTTIRARIKTERTIVIGADGSEYIVSASLSTFPDTPRIPPGSKVTLPVEFGGTTSTVVAEGLHDSGLPSLPSYYRFDLE